MRYLGCLLLLSLPGFAASPLIFGARGGAGVNDDSNSVAQYASGSGIGKTYLIGPTLGLRLPLGFSVEGDALYNRQSLNLNNIQGINVDTKSESWEFPVMLKFTAGHGLMAPLIGAGVNTRHINDFGSIPTYLLTGSTNENSVGFTASGGIQFAAGPVHIVPEVRYTRWNSGTLTQTIVDNFVPGRNQVQVLIGVTF